MNDDENKLCSFYFDLSEVALITRSQIQNITKADKLGNQTETLTIQHFLKWTQH